MRVIFVPVAARPESESALQAAFGIGKRLGSDVFGCHFRVTPVEPGNWDMADLWSVREARAWPIVNEEAQQRAADEAKRLFESMAARFDYSIREAPGSRDRPSARWETRAGAPTELMPLLGAASDMIVVSRPLPQGGEKSWIVLTSALLDSLTPVLVLPQEGTPTSARRIAIAWGGGRTETLALHAALMLVKAAEDVVFVSVGNRRPPGGPGSEEMIRYLAAHGVRARARQAERADIGAALIEAASEEGADLLLAGAYTRGRFREMVFGGVTEHLLSSTDFPVLLMHA